MQRTNIEWADYVWNPVTGCSKVSQGCKNCYAETFHHRFEKTRGKFTDVVCHEDRLYQPLRVRKPGRVFVNSMSDLFHEDVPVEFIKRTFSVMASADHTFLILTKRPKRALSILSTIKWVHGLLLTKDNDGIGHILVNNCEDAGVTSKTDNWIPPNIWIGVSCEDQATADERIPLLLQIPAAVRFLSCEPLLGPIDLDKYLPIMEPSTGNDIHWIIAGGESGHKARPMHPDWARSLRDQCAAAGVPFFFKQWGEWLPLEFDSQPPFRCFSNKPNILIDGHLIDVLDPETSEAGKYEGHRFMDPLEALDYCDDSADCDFWKCGKSKSGHLLDGKEHREFPDTVNSQSVH